MDIRPQVISPSGEASAPLQSSGQNALGLFAALRQSRGIPAATPKATGSFFKNVRPLGGYVDGINRPSLSSNQPPSGFFSRIRPVQQAAPQIFNPQQQQQPQTQGLGINGNFGSSGALNPSEILRLIQLGQR